MTRANTLILVFLGAVFGASFLFMRVAAPEVGPWVVAFARVGIAAVALAIVTRGRTLRLVAAEWRALFLLGAVNTALPFGMYAFAETTLTASLGAVINALTPAFMAVAGALWLAQPLTARKIGGIVLGVTGVAMVVGLGPLTLDPATLVAIGACLLAVTGYAIGFSYARRRLPHVDPMTISLGQLLGAALVLAPGALLTRPLAGPSLDAMAAMSTLALLSTALAWPLLFRLNAAIGPTASSTVTFLAPAFGIVWGAFVLGETIGPSLLLGTAVILVSVGLVTGLRLPRVPGAVARMAGSVETMWTTMRTAPTNSETRG